MGEILKKLSINPEIVIAFCALLTSVISIILTILTLRLQKQHYMKSIKPIGRITAGDYEDDIYISIINNGVGPLIVKELKVSNSQLTASSLIDIIPTSINESVVWTDFASNFVNRAIEPSGRIYLVRLTFDEVEKKQDNIKIIKKELRQFLRHLTLELIYTDIYEKKLYRISRSLEWFGRHFSSETTHLQERKNKNVYH